MKAVIQTQGEFKDWLYWPQEAFEFGAAGPFYYKKFGDDYVSRFRSEKKHLNGGGTVHGGCLMTFADFALFAIATDELEGSPSVTMNLSSDFLGTAMPGALMEARGEVTRGGGKTIFVRGLITADGKPAMSFTGIIRKFSKR